jgi:CDP-diacylglycerol--serine O-phosphatidyltransferase
LLIIGGANEICTQQQMNAGAIWVNESFGASIRSLLDFYVGDLTGNPIANAPFHFTAWYLFVPFVALLIPFMSMFRLAKFNLDTRQSEEFIGLPTPANTLFFISFPLMLWDAWGETKLQNKLSMILIQDQILVTFIVFFSFLLIAEFPMISLKFKHYKWIENQYRYALIFCSIVLISLFSFWSLPIILFLYIILSLIKNSQQKTKVNL